MGCPTKCVIGDNITFSVTTHDPDTGVLTDADSEPTWRLYEDETETPILTGSMAKLDDANTAGFYTETVACTAGNGFEDGKTYTVYIEATVDSDTGGICYAFKAVAASPTLAELTGIADAPATPTLNQAVMLLYMWLRNNTQGTSDERRILNDAGVEIMDATMSDVAGVFQQGKLTDP
jgi:hypothetical protein